MTHPFSLAIASALAGLLWMAGPALAQQEAPPREPGEPAAQARQAPGQGPGAPAGQDGEHWDRSTRNETGAGSTNAACGPLPDHARLTEVLRRTVTPGDPSGNGGLGNHVWAVVVDRAGTVCAVARSGEAADDQWPGSRGIAASKANTANAFSLDGFALSTANLYFPSQPGQTLYGIEVTNPASAEALAAGDPAAWGTEQDSLVGRRPGGVVVFGGGLALYTAQGKLVGALGVSGDRSCTDHVIAWKVRSHLDLAHVPNGSSQAKDDNIIYDITTDPGTGEKKSASGFGHPECEPTATQIAREFNSTFPTKQ